MLAAPMMIPGLYGRTCVGRSPHDQHRRICASTQVTSHGAQRHSSASTGSRLGVLAVRLVPRAPQRPNHVVDLVAGHDIGEHRDGVVQVAYGGRV